MKDLILKNGRVVTPTQVIEGGVVVHNGVIEFVGADSELGRAHQEIDVKGMIIFPGMMDPHCHLGSGDERSFEFMKESFAQDTQDALIGGVTSIATTTVLKPDPLPENYKNTLEAGVGQSHVDFKITSVVTRDHHVADIPEVMELGCSSFKFYTGYCGCLAEKMGMNPDGIPPSVFYQACEFASQSSRPRPIMMIHAEEPTVRFMLADRFKESGKNTLLDWAEHSPEWSESVQVYQYGVIAHQFHLPLYVVHISKAHTIDFIRGLQQQGYPIVGETLVSFLSTTAQDLMDRKVGIYGKIQPPIRYHSDQEVLWKSLVDGVVTAIGTDSIPYTSKYKDHFPFWEARPGLNIQLLDSLPLLLTEGIHKGRLDYLQLAKVVAEGPARHFSVFPQKGAIQPGSDADFIVIDPDKEYPLGRHRSLGHNDYSIWEGKKVKGEVVQTFLRGQLVAQQGEIVSHAKGEHLKGGRI
ncbi:MAG: amidohydrolase family protein [Bdellovibrionales bacterium]|nr:amidohydrolase family protein [Bdellovibrionales bacterium]